MALTLWANGQVQNGTQLGNAAGDLVVTQCAILANPTPGVSSTPAYRVKDQATPLSAFSSPAQYFTIAAAEGNAPQTFQMEITFSTSDMDVFSDNSREWSVLENGSPTNSSIIVYHYENDHSTLQHDVLSITHHMDNAWSNAGGNERGVREIEIRCSKNGYAYGFIAFKAVLVGSSWTYTPGSYFDAPVMPLFILRDPPGSKSYGAITTAHSACIGQSFSSKIGSEAGFSAKVKIGTEASIGFLGIEEVPVKAYVEGGISLNVGTSVTSAGEVLRCLTTTDIIQTSDTGAPADVFICSGLKYAYGTQNVVSRNANGSALRIQNFAMVPVGNNVSFRASENTIRNEKIPELVSQIAGLPEGSLLRKRLIAQKTVWERTLDMNDELKANAVYSGYEEFYGDNSGFTHQIESTTTQSRSIDFSVFLEAGLSFEAGVEVAGSGVTIGGEWKLRTEYGLGQSLSNTVTNTMEYHMQDDSPGDHYYVQKGYDPVFGTYAFRLMDEPGAHSRTSCPYEGGYQIDQPQLWVGNLGQSEMTLNEVPIGGNAIFPIHVCNNSDQEREYDLRLDAGSNALGAIISGYNGITSGSTVQLTVPANGCQTVGNIYLSQPDNSVVDFQGVEIELTSACERNIHSAINISAHFGVGNVGDYCVPFSDVGTAEGDLIDGVQLGSINNTSSGDVTGPSYSDLHAQFSTGLSRDAQALLTVTTGTYTADVFAAWIDYDHSGTFDPQEKLGDQAASASGQTLDFPFTVPGNATLGATRMRVRGCENYGQPLDPCYNYYYGETEDYGIVIDANTPLDCEGTPNGPALPGTACDDGDPGTGDDAFSANCICIGQLLDCLGVLNGTTLPGNTCDDGDANTAGDVYGADCTCAGLPFDCQGTLGGDAWPGTTCDDGDATTGNDSFGNDCICYGQLIDCTGTPGGSATVGSPCDDGDPQSTNDAYTPACECAGTFVNDCLGVSGGTAQPGTPCDDNDPNTGNDIYYADCTCAGLLVDCSGMPGGTNLPGSPCNDWNVQTINDVYTSGCACAGEMTDVDCQGVQGGQALPGTPCDDGQACSANDTWSTGCYCIGGPAFTVDLTSNLPVCQGSDITIVAHITDTVPGTTMYLWQGPGNFSYNSDVYDFIYLAGADPALVNGLWVVTASHNGCVGMPGLIDVEVTPDTDNDGLCDPDDNCPELTGQQGDACDDGDANTVSDVITAECVCVGELSTGIISRTQPAASIRYDRANSTVFVSEVEQGPVVLLDATGQLVQSLFGQAVRFQVASLPSGLYVVRSANLAERVVVVH